MQRKKYNPEDKLGEAIFVATVLSIFLGALGLAIYGIFFGERAAL